MIIQGLSEFLYDYPGMAVQPFRLGGPTIIEGRFRFAANDDIRDTYDLRITIQPNFPREVPTVVEVGGKIPREPYYHVNPDTTLCLGSPLRLKKMLADQPDLVAFAEKCLVPYLVKVSAHLQRGEELVGLKHGMPGIVDDYADLFGLSSVDQILRALELLAMKKRLANKQHCPCRCRLRLGRCPTHLRLNALRRVAPRSWYAMHAQQIRREVEALAGSF